MNKLTITQAYALAHIHDKMHRFLAHYAAGNQQPEFFINGMESLISRIDTFVRENGDYNCQPEQAIIINKKFLKTDDIAKIKEGSVGPNIRRQPRKIKGIQTPSE